MFTVEHEFDYTSVTILDNAAKSDDVELIFDDEYVYIRQYDNEDDFNIVVITNSMFEEMIASYCSPEGSFMTRDKS